MTGSNGQPDDDIAAEVEHDRWMEVDEDAIKARLASITAGPWYRNDNDSVISWTARPSHLGPVMVLGLGVADDGVTPTAVLPDGVDAEFIANAPRDIEWLLDRCEYWQAKYMHVRERLTDGQQMLEVARQVISEMRREVTGSQSDDIRAALDVVLQRIVQRTPLPVITASRPSRRPWPFWLVYVMDGSTVIRRVRGLTRRGVTRRAEKLR